MQEVNIARLKACGHMAYRIMRPLLALGAPGIGKSAAFKQMANELGIDFLDVRATLLDPVDLRGIPTVKKIDITKHIPKEGETFTDLEGEEHTATAADVAEVYQTVWAQPVFLPTAGSGLLLIDELPTAPPLVQAALLQLILDRQLGEYFLPEGWLPVAAGNNVTDKAGASKLNTALASRFIRLSVVCDHKEWNVWALDSEIATEVTSYLNWKPQDLHQFDPKDNGAFPCPRTWEFASDVVKDINAQPSNERDDYVNMAMIEGCVGEAVAAEFTGFLRIVHRLKAPEVYLNNPEKEELPSTQEPAVLYALCGALAERAVDMENGKPVHAEALVKIANRLPAEYSVVLVDTAIRRNAAFADTRDYIQWSIKHSHVI